MQVVVWSIVRTASATLGRPTIASAGTWNTVYATPGATTATATRLINCANAETSSNPAHLHNATRCFLLIRHEWINYTKAPWDWCNMYHVGDQGRQRPLAIFLANKSLYFQDYNVCLRLLSTNNWCFYVNQSVPWISM